MKIFLYSQKYSLKKVISMVVTHILCHSWKHLEFGESSWLLFGA